MLQGVKGRGCRIWGSGLRVLGTGLRVEPIASSYLGADRLLDTRNRSPSFGELKQAGFPQRLLWNSHIATCVSGPGHPKFGAHCKGISAPGQPNISPGLVVSSFSISLVHGTLCYSLPCAQQFRQSAVFMGAWQSIH